MRAHAQSTQAPEAPLRLSTPWESTTAGHVIHVGELELWPEEHQVFLAGHRLPLTPREFEVLLALASNAGHVVSKDRIHTDVWGKARPHRRDRCVDVFVRKLRGKLERAAPRVRFIHTHFALGYRFEPEPEEEK